MGDALMAELGALYRPMGARDWRQKVRYPGSVGALAAFRITTLPRGPTSSTHGVPPATKSPDCPGFEA